MATARLTETDLIREIAEFRDRYPKLGDDELFVLFFLRAFVAEDEAAATAGLCGGSRDKGVDAVLIDDPARIVFVVQGKYRQKVAAKNEQAFRKVCGRDITGVMTPLLRVIDAVFVAVLRFYRGKRGSGQKAIDVSTFFQRRNLHKEFGKHWRGSGNTSRTAFNRAWAKFRQALDEEMAT